MGGKQSNLSSAEFAKYNISSCPNDQTCKNFDFSRGKFACPNATCENNMCNCGSECIAFEGTCCRNVIVDPKTGNLVCIEGTGETLPPFPYTQVPTLPPTMTPTIAPTTAPTQRPTMQPTVCNVSDQYVQVNGTTITIPGQQICDWYKMYN